MSLLRHILFAAIALVVVCVSNAPADAAERNLSTISASQTAVEVNGLGAPDAKFVLTEKVAEKGAVAQIARVTDLGDQGNGQIVERSDGCSSGCSSGCSVGCSSGCSMGCSTGCSMGCR